MWPLPPELASVQQAALYHYSELSYQTTKSQKAEEQREGAGCTGGAAAWPILRLAGVRSAACSHSFPLTNGTLSESQFNINFQLLATLWWHLVDQSKTSLPAGKPCKAWRVNPQSGSLFPRSKELYSIRQGLAFLCFFLPFLLCEWRKFSKNTEVYILQFVAKVTPFEQKYQRTLWLITLGKHKVAHLG